MSDHKLSPEELKATLAKLTTKQRAFAEEYSIDKNATQAAIRAGYAAGSATVQGSRLLANAKVSKYAAHLCAEVTERAKYGAQEFFRDLLEVTEHARSLALQDDVEPAMIGAYRGMAETLGKHVDLQAFKERIEVETKTDAAETLEEALARAEAASKAALAGKRSVH
jgi:phage terminase small subunit